MGDFRRDTRGGGRSFGRSSFGGSKSFDRRPQMHKALCSNCGKECELPFKPTGDRPVYCRDCFATHGEGERRDDRPRRFEDSRPAHTPPPPPLHEKKLDDINFKLDQILKLLNPAPKQTPQPIKIDAGKDLGIVIKKKRVSKKVSGAPVETPSEDTLE